MNPFTILVGAFIVVMHMLAVRGNVKVITNRHICLSSHNALRALHSNTPNMQWDDNLQQEAETYAKHLASTGKFEHATLSGIGENLYKGSGECPKSCARAAFNWYNEINLYSYNNPGFSFSTGHFTQVVWKSSIKLGVGVAVKDNGSFKTTVIVARYKPGGNVRNIFQPGKNFQENVLPRKFGARTPNLLELDPNAEKHCGPCVDRNQYCHYFIKQSGFCQDKGLAKYNCAKSCKYC